jgi:hypothetical protein
VEIIRTNIENIFKFKLNAMNNLTGEKKMAITEKKMFLLPRHKFESYLQKM